MKTAEWIKIIFVFVLLCIAAFLGFIYGIEYWTNILTYGCPPSESDILGKC